MSVCVKIDAGLFYFAAVLSAMCVFVPGLRRTKDLLLGHRAAVPCSELRVQQVGGTRSLLLRGLHTIDCRRVGRCVA